MRASGLEGSSPPPARTRGPARRLYPPSGRGLDERALELWCRVEASRVTLEQAEEALVALDTKDRDVCQRANRGGSVTDVRADIHDGAAELRRDPADRLVVARMVLAVEGKLVGKREQDLDPLDPVPDERSRET